MKLTDMNGNMVFVAARDVVRGYAAERRDGYEPRTVVICASNPTIQHVREPAEVVIRMLDSELATERAAATEPVRLALLALATGLQKAATSVHKGEPSPMLDTIQRMMFAASEPIRALAGDR
jgi:hypothetical protein